MLPDPFTAARTGQRRQRRKENVYSRNPETAENRENPSPTLHSEPQVSVETFSRIIVFYYPSEALSSTLFHGNELKILCARNGAVANANNPPKTLAGVRFSAARRTGWPYRRAARE